jgi:RNA polymerase sigma factor (sigma-70 family)
MATGQINRVIEHLRKTLRTGDTAEISDGQLLECFVARREERGFELLLQRHGPMVLSVCKRVLGSHQDAEDAFQATFLVLARKAGSIRPREMVGNWLYGVACKTALRARSLLAKRQAREKQMNPLPEPEAPAPDSWPEVQQVLDEELSRLSDKYRAPIILCDLEDKSQKEAAQRLGLPEGTLSSRLSRGRAMLAKRLARRGVTLSAGALAAMLSPKGVSAGVPAALASATLKAGRAFAAGQSVAGLVSSAVVSLTEGVLKAMLLTKLTQVSAAFLLGCFSIGVWAQIPSATGQSEGGIKAESRAVPLRGPAGKVQDQVNSFDDLSPAARLQILRKITDPDKEFQSAERGDVILSLNTHGSLASGNSSDIYCQVRANPMLGQPSVGNPFATTIKSVVDEGTKVHKGDVLVSLDDSYLQEQLKDKWKAHQKSLAAIASAEGALERGKLQTELRELECEIAVRVAELKVKKFAGNDPDEKEILKLEVKKAHVSWQLAKMEGKSRLSLAKANVETKREIAKRELAQLEDIKDQISKCTIKAPKDGVVYYYVPEETRGNVYPLIAQGEPVREGQKLLQIPDLDNMVASIRVPQALVASLHGEGKDKSKWQAALIKVDAYPKTVLKGHVRLVDRVAASDHFFATGEKVYKTLVAIDKDQNAKMPRLKPGMSAEVTIEEVARKNDVVRLPVKAVVQVGARHYCYVKVGKEILKREVTLGLRGHRFVEIKSGVQEDDLVVRDVDGLVRQLSPFLGPGKK